MSWLPLLVMNGILLAITLILALAGRLLVTYGTCVIKVTEGDDTQQFDVEGGETLLTALTGHGVKLSSSCGGKGTCGYCKVQVVSGAGPLLPTEEIFMSRAEKLRGVHLGCQVKVKMDMEIVIPDFLMTVREAVKHGRFDARKRWKFTVT